MKSIIILPLLLIASFVQAQKGTNSFSVIYGEGVGRVRPFLEAPLATIKASAVNTFGVNYTLGINKYGMFESGVMLLQHTYHFSYFSATPFPSPALQTEKTLTALILPLKLRFDLLKYFFVSGGPLVDVDISDGIKPSLGVGIGVGAQYMYKGKYGIFIYPQTNFHTLDIGLAEKHISFGLSYRFYKN